MKSLMLDMKIMLFRGLRVAIAEAGGAVEAELRAPVAGEELHLLARQQGGRVGEVAERERSGASLDAHMYQHLYRYAAVLHDGAVRGSVMEVEDVAHRVRCQFGAARNRQRLCR